MIINKFNLNEEGLKQFFGPLEARIMDILWSSEGITIRDVQTILNHESPISFNAVMTVMNRLMDKGHLKKLTSGKGRNRITLFNTVQSKEQFLNKQTKALTHGLMEEFGGMVVSHMIDALEHADPELIARLERKIIEMKNRKPS